MQRKIKVVGISSYQFETLDNTTVDMCSVHYIYDSNNIEGNGTGRFSLSFNKFDKLGISLGSIGTYCYDRVDNKDKFVAFISD